MINEGNSVNHPQSVLINGAHAILGRTESMLTHLYWEAYQCADRLARIGAEQDEDLVVSVDKPLLIREFMIRGLNLRQFLD
ncbi:hypothetical protein RHSIM_Rhsim10G0181700 [Rhododendron simsii]|uniref:Uncharacterized protein n=1 Tax=Rhododendron simsii TaxID=118357 RepID=A0A834GGA0_RHOSS|nr:hypothetical protein RHSIM_Rhsim10G0181700 [Rhododendron simsii]